MGRPPRIPHPIEDALADRFSASTLRTYGDVAKQVEESGLPAAEWLRKQVSDRAEAARAARDPGKSMPKQTLTVYRAAVAQYLAWREGENPREIARTLPSVNPLRAGRERDKLSPAQLARYRELAEQAREPQRTILLLLPLTGCRISEVCTLTRANVTPDAIRVYAKRGKERRVPLSGAARRLLEAYLARHGSSGARVFEIGETWGGEPLDEPRPCTPRDVWRVVETWEADRAEGGLLEGVALHQTRHTAASAMVKKGAKLATVRDVLGHESLRTLSRYVHADDDEKAAAVALLDEP